MKKSSFVAMMLGTVSGVLFALGMCMALLPEWNAMKTGIIMGSIGIILGIITLVVWRKMENKAPIRLKGKTIAVALYGVFGALVLGVGMSLCLVSEKFVLGTIVGLAGILLLLALIPITKGIK